MGEAGGGVDFVKLLMYFCRFFVALVFVGGVGGGGGGLGGGRVGVGGNHCIQTHY